MQDQEKLKLEIDNIKSKAVVGLQVIERLFDKQEVDLVYKNEKGEIFGIVLQKAFS